MTQVATLREMEVKTSRRRLYLVLLLGIGVIATSVVAFSLFTSEKVVATSKSNQSSEGGLDSPYR